MAVHSAQLLAALGLCECCPLMKGGQSQPSGWSCEPFLTPVKSMQLLSLVTPALVLSSKAALPTAVCSTQEFLAIGLSSHLSRAPSLLIHRINHLKRTFPFLQEQQQLHARQVGFPTDLSAAPLDRPASWVGVDICVQSSIINHRACKKARPVCLIFFFFQSAKAHVTPPPPSARQRAVLPLVFSPVHLFLVIDCLISSLCERKQISSNLQQ